MSETVAQAFDHTKALHQEGFHVTVSDIAGARFVSRGDARVIEKVAVAA